MRKTWVIFALAIAMAAADVRLHLDEANLEYQREMKPFMIDVGYTYT